MMGSDREMQGKSLQGPLSRLASMRKLSASLLALGLGVAAAMALASCGGDDADLLPGETAREITANLDAVEDLANSGDCEGAQSAAQQVSDQIAALGGVDRRLKQALRTGATRLNEVVENCVETTTESISPAVIPGEDTTESPEKERRPREDEEDGGEDEGNNQERDEREEREEEAPTPPATRPTTPSTPQGPPPAGGGTGAPGGVAPGAPAGEDGD